MTDTYDAIVIGAGPAGEVTHGGKYQGRVAAADMLGHGHPADYRAVPRVVFTERQLAAVGEAEGAAAATADLRSVARAYTYSPPRHGASSRSSRTESGSSARTAPVPRRGNGSSKRPSRSAPRSRSTCSPTRSSRFRRSRSST